jgi:hypothetical protein
VRLTVDCSSLEPLVMAAGTVRLRRKKGKFSICGVLSLLGQIKRKLDRIFAGPALKLNCRRKWVWVVGLSTSGGGWAHGSDQKSDSSLSSDLGHYLLPGLDLGTSQKMSTGLILEPDHVKAPSLEPSEGNFLGSEDGLELATRGVMPFSSSSCLGVPVSFVSELSPSVCVCGSITEDVGVKDSGDSPAMEATLATAASIGYDAGDGFADGNGSADADKLLVPSFLFPSAEDFLVGFLSKDWDDFFSSRPADHLGVSLKEVFAVPWEVDEPVSSSCKDEEDIQVVRPSVLAKSLIRRGFFGLRAVSPPPMVLKEVLPVLKGKDPTPKVGSSSVTIGLPSSHVYSSFDGAAVMEPRRESGTPSNSFVSMSQLWYTRRVKEKVAKQLNKNKVLIAEVVGVIPEVGEDWVANALNLAPVLRLTWGGEDKKLRDLVEASVPKVKGMRELKNLDCTISPMKGKRLQGWLGSKNAFSFPPEVH